MNLNLMNLSRRVSIVGLRILAVAAVGISSACSDEEGDICAEFSQPQIIPNEAPACLSDSPTVVGTVATRSIILQSRGSDPLVIETGADTRIEDDDRGHFSLLGIMPDSTVVCPETTFAGIEYRPTEPGWDAVNLIVRSNAQNFPTLRIFMLALAVPPNDPDFDPGPKPDEAFVDGVEACPDNR